jgi:hypothetical protein
MLPKSSRNSQPVSPRCPTSPRFKVQSSLLRDAPPQYPLPAVIHAHSQMTTAIKNGFEGKRFPSVRRITLPCPAHEIIKRCPNLEEVTCSEGDGSTIVGSLVKGNCRQVRVIKGIRPPLTARTLHRYQRMTHCERNCFVDRFGQAASQLEAYRCAYECEPFFGIWCVCVQTNLRSGM